MGRSLATVALLVTLAVCPLGAQDEQQPLTEKETRQLIKEHKEALDPVFPILEERGVDFDLDLDHKIEREMRRAGATDDLIQAIWMAGPTSRAARKALLTSATGVQLEATLKEAMGYQTLQDEVDPNTKLRMVDEFEGRFPDSQLLSYVYTQAAKACQQKGELNRVVEYGEKSLQLDAENLFSMILVAITLPQPRMLEGSGADKARNLLKAESLAKRALQLIEEVPRQELETDEQYQSRKGALASDAHAALGMVGIQRDEPDQAIEEFKMAISSTVSPNPQLYFRLGEVYANSGRREEAIEAFTKAAEMGRGTVLETYANNQLEELKKQ